MTLSRTSASQNDAGSCTFRLFTIFTQKRPVPYKAIKRITIFKICFFKHFQQMAMILYHIYKCWLIQTDGAIRIVETATLIKNINSGLDSGKYWWKLFCFSFVENQFDEIGLFCCFCFWSQIIYQYRHHILYEQH